MGESSNKKGLYADEYLLHVSVLGETMRQIYEFLEKIRLYYGECLINRRIEQGAFFCTFTFSVKMSHQPIHRDRRKGIIRRRYDPNQTAHRTYTPWPLDGGWIKVIPKEHKFTFGPTNHTVKSGESYWKIAELYYGHGKYYQTIKKANGNKETIHPGNSLNIPQLKVPYMEAFTNTKGDDQKIKKLLGQLSEADWNDFIKHLDPAVGLKHSRLLQKIEMMRVTGKTFDEMAAAQLTFLEGKATAAGKSVGDYLKGEAASRGYGGSKATWWPSLSKKQKRQWTRRFNAAVKDIKKNAPADVKAIIKKAESRGGGFVWAPEDNERLGAFGFTRKDWKLYAGKEWLLAAQSNRARVYANIAHEMVGHNEYGTAVSWEKIMKGALDKMPPAERTKAHSGGNSVYSAYGYMETEIFAELYEHKYDRADNPTDHPFDFPGDTTGRFEDVKKKLQSIKDNYEPQLAEAIVRGLWIRAKFDDFISDATKTKFKDRVKTVFSISLP